VRLHAVELTASWFLRIEGRKVMFATKTALFHSFILALRRK